MPSTWMSILSPLFKNYQTNGRDYKTRSKAQWQKHFFRNNCRNKLQTMSCHFGGSYKYAYSIVRINTYTHAHTHTQNNRVSG